MKIEAGKTYDISAYYKKSLYEIEMFKNTETSQSLNTEVCWRNGTFRVRIEDEEEANILQQSIGEDGDIWDYEDYSEVELVDTFDGCSEDFEFYGPNWDEESQEELQEAYEDDDECFSAYDFLENRGYDSLGCNWQIHGGVTAEEVEDPDAY